MNQFKELPSVNEILNILENYPVFTSYKRNFLKLWINEIFSHIRREIKNGKYGEYSRDDFIGLIVKKLEDKINQIEKSGINRVINGTGVIIHTNLGRAPINIEILKKIPFTLSGYTNLEFNLKTGKRGHRDDNISQLLRELFNVEDGTVVNNNAAAVFIILNTFAKGKEVLVSRGELVEIGGSFRIPEIMEKSGAILKEVGTTNKTKIEDYEKNITENTAMILKVHRSNFKILGFTHAPSTTELVEVSKKHNLLFFEDAGSGLLFEDLSYFFKNSEEPIIKKELESGVDIISFSGDKLMGGPQGGIILGRKNLIEKIRKNQLMRILRLDKIAYFLLCETLKNYLKNEETDLFKLINEPYDNIEKRSRKFLKEIKKHFLDLNIKIQNGFSMIGGGSTPGEKINSPILKIEIEKPELLLKILRENSPPVILRIEENHIVIDLRTVFTHQEKELVFALKNALELYYGEI